MKRIQVGILLTAFLSYSLSVTAQATTARVEKPVRAWVYTKQGSIQEGILYGFNNDAFVLYPGTAKDYINKKERDLTSIKYDNINLIKVKKHGGVLRGLLIGGAIGIAPVVFGQGGAFVAIVTFPLGVITGAIVGATSKKKYLINGDLDAFNKFVDKYAK